MDTPAHIKIALTQVGVREDPHVPNGGPPSLRYMGGRREPWCAHFVCWCFRQANNPIPGDIPAAAPSAPGEMPVVKEAWNPLAAASVLASKMREHGWWLPPTIIPEVGDLVFCTERGKSDPAGLGTPAIRHVGLVYRVTDGSILSVDGNWSDSVARVTRTIGAPIIAGFGRVPYPAR